jgi:hypothetical protein
MTFAHFLKSPACPPSLSRIKRCYGLKGRLFINWPRNFKSELFAESESRFFFKVRPFQLIFSKDGTQVTYMEFVSVGETIRLKRIK